MSIMSVGEPGENESFFGRFGRPMAFHRSALIFFCSSVKALGFVANFRAATRTRFFASSLASHTILIGIHGSMPSSSTPPSACGAHSTWDRSSLVDVKNAVGERSVTRPLRNECARIMAKPKHEEFEHEPRARACAYAPAQPAPSGVADGWRRDTRQNKSVAAHTWRLAFTLELAICAGLASHQRQLLRPFAALVVRLEDVVRFLLERELGLIDPLVTVEVAIDLCVWRVGRVEAQVLR